MKQSLAFAIIAYSSFSKTVENLNFEKLRYQNNLHICQILLRLRYLPQVVLLAFAAILASHSMHWLL